MRARPTGAVELDASPIARADMRGAWLEWLQADKPPCRDPYARATAANGPS